MPLDARAAPAISLSVIIPCFNEQQTLEECLKRVLAIRSEGLRLQVIVVDDCSTDGSGAVAHGIARSYPEVRVIRHDRNRGKGAALRTGFAAASGDFVAIQDADLEYDPQELLDLLGPLRQGRADVVVGSRFTGHGPHRVLYFWHAVGNAVLTLLSNMFTDLNLTDMETCYKVCRRDVLQKITLEEDRFGCEPELIAKLAHKGLRIYEMAISYDGRTYEEGKKITWKDGVRALYCIFRYNAEHLPLPMQFLIYAMIGGAAAGLNLLCFELLLAAGASLPAATALAFILAALANYLLCIALLFRHKARWNSAGEIFMYVLVVAVAGGIDLGITTALASRGVTPGLAKALASLAGLGLNFAGRRYLVF